MLTKPHFWTAFHLEAAVRLVTGVHCPNCGTELRAQDVELLGDGDLQVGCSGCHVVICVVEKR
jgi:hypothetical protein